MKEDFVDTFLNVFLRAILAYDLILCTFLSKFPLKRFHFLIIFSKIITYVHKILLQSDFALFLNI